MALTVTYDFPVSDNISRNLDAISGFLAFDASYPSGGEALDFSPKFRNLKLVQFEASGGYLFEYDHTNGKVIVRQSAAAHLHTITITGAEAGTQAIGISTDADGASLSKTTATDRTGITGVQNSTAAVAGEVAAATDLSSLTAVRFIAFGIR